MPGVLLGQPERFERRTEGNADKGYEATPCTAKNRTPKPQRQMKRRPSRTKYFHALMHFQGANREYLMHPVIQKIGRERAETASDIETEYEEEHAELLEKRSASHRQARQEYARAMNSPEVKAVRAEILDPKEAEFKRLRDEMLAAGWTSKELNLI